MIKSGNYRREESEEFLAAPLHRFVDLCLQHFDFFEERVDLGSDLLDFGTHGAHQSDMLVDLFLVSQTGRLLRHLSSNFVRLLGIGYFLHFGCLLPFGCFLHVVYFLIHAKCFDSIVFGDLFVLEVSLVGIGRSAVRIVVGWRFDF